MTSYRRKFQIKQQHASPPTTNYGRAPSHYTTAEIARRGAYIDRTAPKLVNISYEDLHRDVRPVIRDTLDDEELQARIAQAREKRKAKSRHRLRRR